MHPNKSFSLASVSLTQTCSEMVVEISVTSDAFRLNLVNMATPPPLLVRSRLNVLALYSCHRVVIKPRFTDKNEMSLYGVYEKLELR